jgi:hypothetical protein
MRRPGAYRPHGDHVTPMAKESSQNARAGMWPMTSVARCRGNSPSKTAAWGFPMPILCGDCRF